MATPSVTLTLGDLSLVLNEMGLTSVSAADLFRRLQSTPHLAPPLGFTIPRMGPSLAQNIVVIHVDALEAALANLNLTDIITASQLITAVKREEEDGKMPNVKLSSSFSYASILHLCDGPKSHSRDQPGSFPPYKSTFTMEPVEDGERVRLRKLRDLVRKDFPGGN